MKRLRNLYCRWRGHRWGPWEDHGVLRAHRCLRCNFWAGEVIIRAHYDGGLVERNGRELREGLKVRHD